MQFDFMNIFNFLHVHVVGKIFGKKKVAKSILKNTQSIPQWTPIYENQINLLKPTGYVMLQI